MARRSAVLPRLAPRRRRFGLTAAVAARQRGGLASPIGSLPLSPFGLFQLALSTLIFLGAASVAKSWALAPSGLKMLATLALYSLGNLIMLRLVREFGMGIAFSLSAVIQLIAVNLVAFTVFGERVGTIEAAGIALAVASVAVITLGPQIAGR